MKTWLITGATSGLGLEMTRKLLGRGDQVVACGRRTEPLQTWLPDADGRLHISRFDLTDTASLRREVDAAFAGHGPIDVVMSNAGYGLFGAAEEVSDAQIERQLATNLVASIQLVRAVLSRLRVQGGGRILQISSEGGQVAYPGFSLYHASKWGIEGFLESVAQEVAPFGIDVVIAEPGPTATGFRAGIDFAEPLTAYSATPPDMLRKTIVSGGFELKGDVGRTADALIAELDAPRPRRRITLGSLAFDNIKRALTERLDELGTQKALAFSADR